jgi:deoxycytidine triphosphate deaminase
MILSSDSIRKLIRRDPPLIRPVPPERYADIEGCCYDLTLESLSLILPNQLHRRVVLPFIGPSDRKLAESLPLPLAHNGVLLDWAPKTIQFDDGSMEKYSPMYLLKTVESINCPDHIMPLIFSKVTMFQNGISLETAPVKPGYSGQLVFGARAAIPVRLYRGARIATVMFMKIGPGSTDLYSGERGGDKPQLTGTWPER